MSCTAADETRREGASPRGARHSAHGGPERPSRRLGPEHVAPLLALADIISKLGSGMSVRFFSL